MADEAVLYRVALLLNNKGELSIDVDTVAPKDFREAFPDDHAEWASDILQVQADLMENMRESIEKFTVKYGGSQG